jgi:hypothetical protein
MTQFSAKLTAFIRHKKEKHKFEKLAKLAIQEA